MDGYKDVNRDGGFRDSKWSLLESHCMVSGDMEEWRIFIDMGECMRYITIWKVMNGRTIDIVVS